MKVDMPLNKGNQTKHPPWKDCYPHIKMTLCYILESRKVNILTSKSKQKCKNVQQARGCPRGIMVKAMDSGIVVSKFVLQSRYYIHFLANTLEKGMNPLILPAMG